MDRFFISITLFSLTNFFNSNFSFLKDSFLYQDKYLFDNFSKFSDSDIKKELNKYRNHILKNIHKLYEEIIDNAKTDAVSLKERTMLEIEREKEKAEFEIRKQAVDLAVELSVKALDQKIDEDTHRKLIGDFIAKVGM